MEIKKAILTQLPETELTNQPLRTSAETAATAEGISGIVDSVENASSELANATIGPNWTDQNTHDPGISLMELFTYTADQLSYKQDQVSEEAYLRTKPDPDKKDP